MSARIGFGWDMLACRRRMALVVGLVLLGCLSETLTGRAARAQASGETPSGNSASPSLKPSEGQPATGKSEGRVGDREMELAGRVVGPDGKAVPNARLYLIYDPETVRFMHGLAGPDSPPPVRAVTGADGTFRFTARRFEVEPPGAPLPPMLLTLPAELAAAEQAHRDAGSSSGSSLGIAWGCVAAFEATGELRRSLLDGRPPHYESWVAKYTEPVLRLVKDDVPLTGRVLNDKGRPVAGAKLSVVEPWRMNNEDLSAWLDGVQSGKWDYDTARNKCKRDFLGGMAMNEDQLSRLVWTTTDATGEFCLRGIGRERIAGLRIEGPGIQTIKLYARTRQGPTLAVHHAFGGAERLTFYGARFDHVAPSSIPVVGTVRDLDTGRPVPGVVLLAKPTHAALINAVRAISDAQGHYELSGIAFGQGHRIEAYSLREPYLPAEKSVDIVAGGNRASLDFELKRGVWLRGQVRDLKTDKPAPSWMEYFAFADNPHQKSAPPFPVQWCIPSGKLASDLQGNYAIAGLPGRGIVTAFSRRGDDLYRRGAGAEMIPGFLESSLRDLWLMFPTVPVVNAGAYHGLAEANPDATAREVILNIQLDPGQTLSGRVLDPEGRALPGARVAGDVHWSYGSALRTEEFRVRKYSPKEARTLLFYHPERKLAAMRIVEGPQEEPIVVRLQPCGTLVGRLLDTRGQPLADVFVNQARGYSAETEQAGRGICLPEDFGYVPNREGRFRIEGLAPGAKYSLEVADKNGTRRKQLTSNLTLEPGQMVDLDDVTVEFPGSLSP